MSELEYENYQHWDVNILKGGEWRRRLIDGLLLCSGQLLDSMETSTLWLCRVRLPVGSEEEFRATCRPTKFALMRVDTEARAPQLRACEGKEQRQ